MIRKDERTCHGLALERVLHPMKLKFCGAAGTTTGSQHLLEVNGKRILLDCGLYQGSAQARLRGELLFPLLRSRRPSTRSSSRTPTSTTAAICPTSASKGFTGNIYATDATRDLCQIMLADSARIQESDIDWLNKHRKKNGLRARRRRSTPSRTRRRACASSSAFATTARCRCAMA